jgi:hypothetical protein
MYEYGTLKPVEVILRREGGRRIIEGMNQTRVYICIYGNVTTKLSVQQL